MSAGILLETPAIMSISQHTGDGQFRFGRGKACSRIGSVSRPYYGAQVFPARTSKPDNQSNMVRIRI
jgi:hypothetical protein